MARTTVGVRLADGSKLVGDTEIIYKYPEETKEIDEWLTIKAVHDTLKKSGSIATTILIVV